MSSASPKWLSLTQAADQLGIHPTTLRRWADNGDIPVYVTPGGHRRFLESDINQYLGDQHPTSPNIAGQVWASSALVATQQRLRNNTHTQWLDSFDEAQRHEKRQLGQRLLGLIMQHISMPDDDQSLLVEARSIADRYAENCITSKLTAAQGLEIVLFFRDSMSEVALQMPQVANFDDEKRLRLMRKINQVFNFIQLCLIEYYEQEELES